MESDNMEMKEKIINVLAEDGKFTDYLRVVRDTRDVTDFSEFLDQFVGVNYYKLDWTIGGALSKCFGDNYSHFYKTSNKTVLSCFNYTKGIPESDIKKSKILRLRSSELEFDYSKDVQVGVLDLSYSKVHINNINFAGKILFEDNAECIIDNLCDKYTEGKTFFELTGDNNKLTIESKRVIINSVKMVIILNGQRNKVDIDLSSVLGEVNVEIQVESCSKDNVVHLTVPDPDYVFVNRVPFSKCDNLIIVNDEQR